MNQFVYLMNNKRILVAPLNWGLGHATRCVPIINELLLQGVEVVLASDGLALTYLTTEFPKLPYYTLAELNVTYASNTYWQMPHIFFQIPKLYKFISQDQLMLSKLVTQIHIDGIVSDCRPGVYAKGIKSVYVNHQLNVKTGITTKFSSHLHQELMKNFTEIWVPDVKKEPSLSGDLGHLKQPNQLPPIQYLGWISRLKLEKVASEYDYCAVLSGPEPQRTLFEKMIEQLFKKLSGKKICVTGNTESKEASTFFEKKAMLNSSELNTVIAASKIVICRSGYTSLLDLLKMKKPALLVPTPGQFEQEYLANRMQKLEWFSVCKQSEFEHKAFEMLNTVYKNKLPTYQDFNLDFSVFKCDSE